ncbi:MAG: UTP--glucose-1-phosphate uridylyltransferase [Bdellovibrionaceae bacterium]|nr:UTP--glucose-1-phosphate uridylyltransferase [Pseudobdellovibrionaceae bacterium]
MKKIKKALIPAAGLGTRFLPATKSVPKEMLTIVDAPIIFYVVEEAVKAGIEDIVLIAGRGKHAIEDFFDTSYEVEDKLLKDGKVDLLNRLEQIRNMANIISIRQKQAFGLGHAVHSGKTIIGNEPFAVLLGDEITVNLDNQSSATEDLVRAFERTGHSGLSVMKVTDDQVSKYGVAEFDAEKKETLRIGNSQNVDFYRVKNLLEKPKPSETNSRWAITGRYVFDPKIFSILENQKPTKNNEIQLTDAIQELTRNNVVNAYPLQGRRYDAGDKLGYLITNIEFALRNSELTQELSDYLKQLVNKIDKGSFK